MMSTTLDAQVEHDRPARFYRPDPRHPARLQRAGGEPEEDVADLTAAAIHGALRAFIDDVHYPCVGAKSAIHNGSYRLGVYGELGEGGSTAALARDLKSFTSDEEAFDAEFATFVAVFEEPSAIDADGFEAHLWKQLQQLHDADSRGWDESVSADPDDPHFSFSFGGTAFFVVGLFPASERLSRRFPWPALVFNPHAQFEKLRESDRWERMQQVIRRKEEALQGGINPVLRDFGSESEARQYSGRAVDADWQAPFEPHVDGEPASDIATQVPEPPVGCPMHRLPKGTP